MPTQLQSIYGNNTTAITQEFQRSAAGNIPAPGVGPTPSLAPSFALVVQEKTKPMATQGLTPEMKLAPVDDGGPTDGGGGPTGGGGGGGTGSDDGKAKPVIVQKTPETDVMAFFSQYGLYILAGIVVIYFFVRK